jgi:serine/threonine protein phosphatase 1
MSKTFAVADLHGRFDLLQKALERIAAGNPAGGKIVFLGDYVDRGPQSREVVETLMAGPRDPARWTWVCLKGNHEDMMVSTIGGPDEDWWLANGGTATLGSFGGVLPSDVINWSRNLPLWHSDAHRLFVHAAVDPTKSLEEQSEATLMWMRYDDRADVTFPGRHVVHGHTPLRDGPRLLPGRTNLDTGAVFTGRLVVAVFEDDIPGGPRSFIEILA